MMTFRMKNKELLVVKLNTMLVYIIICWIKQFCLTLNLNDMQLFQLNILDVLFVMSLFLYERKKEFYFKKTRGCLTDIDFCMDSQLLPKNCLRVRITIPCVTATSYCVPTTWTTASTAITKIKLPITAIAIKSIEMQNLIQCRKFHLY